jgi:type VI protein secretion system component VasF
MRTLNTGKNISHWQHRQDHNRGESAVATIWLVFYGLVLAGAVAWPFISDKIDLATR